MDIENPIIEVKETIELECPICFEIDVAQTKMPCCFNQLCSRCFEEWHTKKQEPECVFCRFADVEYLGDSTSNDSDNWFNENGNENNIICDYCEKRHIYILFFIACYAVVMCVIAPLMFKLSSN